MSSTRWVPHDGHPPKAEDLPTIKSRLYDTLQSSLQLVVKHYVGHRPTSCSVYVGVEGVVMMCNYVSVIPSGASLVTSDLAEKLLVQAVSAFAKHPSRVGSGGRASFLETSVGLATLVLEAELRQSAGGHFHASVDGCAGILRDAHRAALDQDDDIMPDDGCEVLYGRAGLLYALLRLRHSLGQLSAEDSAARRAVQPVVADDALRGIVNDIMRRGKIGAEDYGERLRGENAPPLMWSWHGKRYLGGAHGVAGILQILLACPAAVIQPHMPTIMGTVEWLLSIQDKNGNWAHKASSSGRYAAEDNDMVQWCHGAPAVIILLSTVLRRSLLSDAEDLQAKIVSALEAGVALIYERGLLRKGVGLCHGAGGSVFALLAAASAFGARGDETRRSRWLRRAVHLALLAGDWPALTQRGEMGTPDRPYSLYEGLAGMCCAWAAVVAAIDGQVSRGMPGYDDLA